MYEAYNSNRKIQFNSQEEAENYAAQEGLQIREVVLDVFEQAINEPTKSQWYGLEQALYQSPLMFKALNSTGQGFTLFLKVLSDGKQTGASENALQLAFSILFPSLPEPLTAEEIQFINSKLEEFQFVTRI